MSYCKYVLTLPEDSLHRRYHDQEYGFPIDDETLLFERLMLEINQAGLSWDLMLKRQEGFREAFDNWQVDKVAAYTESDIERLLNDPRIIRNRLKVLAAVHNAKVLQEMRSQGGFKAWLDLHHPLLKEEWMKLFKKIFKFTGGEIVNEFLMSTGYLPGCHEDSCPVMERIKDTGPAWLVKPRTS